jgi:hypothetical protein
VGSIYDPAVTTLFATGKVELVTHVSRVDTTIGCMKWAKSKRNKMRDDLGLLKTSKMTITKVKLSDHKVKVIFELIYSVNI